MVETNSGVHKKAPKRRALYSDLVGTTVNCLGKRHTILVLPDGRFKLLQHTAEDVKTADIFEALGGEMPRCVQLLKWWRNVDWKPEWKGSPPKELAEVREHLRKRSNNRKYSQHRQEYQPLRKYKFMAKAEREKYKNSFLRNKLRRVIAEFRALYPADPIRNQYFGTTQESLHSVVCKNIEQYHPKGISGWLEEIYSQGKAFLVPFAITIRIDVEVDGCMVLTVQYDNSQYTTRVLRTHLGTVAGM